MRDQQAVADELVELAELELGLVASQRFDALPELHARRDAALADLRPLEPGHPARAAVERAVAVQDGTARLLERARDELGADLVRLDRGRSAARGYAASSRPGALKRA